MYVDLRSSLSCLMKQGHILCHYVSSYWTIPVTPFLLFTDWICYKAHGPYLPTDRRVLLPFGKVMKLRPGFKNSWGRTLENWDSFVGLPNHRLVTPFLQICFGVLGLEKQRDTLRSSCCACTVHARACGRELWRITWGPSHTCSLEHPGQR